MINLKELKEMYSYLPRDYASLVLKKFPGVSSSRVSQIRKICEKESYNPDSRTIQILSYMKDLAVEQKKLIDNLNKN